MAKKSSFFGLPPPWNPGLAIPASVQAEGLQRHAYVTQMMPRGTYDRSTDGTAGYAVPQYVIEERTGRGAYTTAWLPRGYYGPRLPHWLNRHPTPTIEALSGVQEALGDLVDRLLLPLNPPPPPPPPPAQRYGQKAAAVVLSQVRQAPAANQGRVLSQIMRRIDPGLEAKTNTETARARAQGVPAHKALEVGLGRAMSTGMMAQLTKLGKTRRMPSRASLLGLGMYQELGATLGTVGSQFVSTNSGADSGAVGTGADRQLLLDGDMLFDYKDGATIHVTPTNGAVTSGRMKEIIDRLTWWMTKQPGTAAPPYQVLGGGAGLTYCPNHLTHLYRLFGSLVNENQVVCDLALNQPIYKWTPPGGGADWVVVIANVAPVINGKVSPGFDLKLRQWNTEFLPSLGRGIKNVAGGIKDAVKTVADKVGDLGCSLLKQPGFAQGAAATNPAAGVGVVVAAGMCGSGALPPPVVAPPPDDSLMMTVLLGGGALVALSLLTSKKKQP